MAVVDFTVDVSEVVQVAARMTELRAAVSGPALERILRQGVEVLRDQLERTTREKLAKDPTGALSRSWTSIVTLGKGGSEAVALVGTPLAYARIHDQGGAVKAKAGKYLAIPMRPPVARGLAPSRDPVPMVVLRSKAGRPFLADKAKLSRGIVEARYLLRRQVEIPATNYVQIASRAAERPVVDELLNATVQALRRTLKQ